MLVSHESPIAILEESKSYNDYDYALVHLFESQPEYYSFFKQSLLAGREVLLDNSIFELGEAFDPKKYIRYHSKPVCLGQKQKWYLLQLLSDESKLELDKSSKPEFDSYQWVKYWHPLKKVVPFKRRVYRLALKEFETMIK